MRWFANFWFLWVVCLCGCQWTKKISNDSPTVIRGTSQGIPNKLAIPGQIPATRLAALDEPSAFIPPPLNSILMNRLDPVWRRGPILLSLPSRCRQRT
ncbi:MAG: hypothetical protein N2112_14610 [Gemmataceae bacterium]|nr:hypothetical protein [Gemmataceae bacterium]